MRKILFAIIATLIFSNISFAQTRIGFTGGLTYANMYEKVNNQKSSGDYRLGGTVGVMVDVPMEKNGSFRTGVNFVQKGNKKTYTSGNDNIELIRSMNYVEFPMNILFNIPTKGSILRVGGGPAGAFAISGKNKMTVNNGTEQKSDINFGDKTDSELNWVDLGINLIVEYEFDGGVFLAAGYNRGINRLFVGGSDEDKLYNNYFSLRIGYFLKGKK